MESSIDREKVIKGLDHCANESDCRGCVYQEQMKGRSDECDCMGEALALLKEQEVVKPIKKDTVEITARYEFDCPCGAPLLIGQPYCANCGRSVKWE